MILGFLKWAKLSSKILLSFTPIVRLALVLLSLSSSLSYETLTSIPTSLKLYCLNLSLFLIFRTGVSVCLSAKRIQRLSKALKKRKQKTSARLSRPFISVLHILLCLYVRPSVKDRQHLREGFRNKEY